MSTSNFIILYLYSRGLVLICIDSYGSESRRIFQAFCSTRSAFLCTAPNSEFLQSLPIVCLISANEIRRVCYFRVKFVVFRTNFDEHLSEFDEIATQYFEALLLRKKFFLQMNVFRKIFVSKQFLIQTPPGDLIQCPVFNSEGNE